MQTQTRAFLAALWQGGRWVHYWTPNGPEELGDNGKPYRTRVSLWFAVDNIPDAPSVWRDVELYFSVNPARVKRGERQKIHIDDVAALNCVFAEFDAKDFGSKQIALAHIRGLQPPPSVVVDSGGGFHCYWLLDEPFIVHSEEERERARLLQYVWVDAMRGDPGAKDLARVLRVPGTFNHKYSPPRPVEFVTCELERRYSFADLEKAVAGQIQATIDAKQTVVSAPGAGARLDDQELIRRAMDAPTNGALFARLWAGQHDGDHSAADQALVNLLAYWTGKDDEQMDRLFRQSGLYREKWERKDYREATLSNAKKGVRNVFGGILDKDTEDAIKAAQSAVFMAQGANGMSTGHTNGTTGQGASAPLQSIFLTESADHEGNAQCVFHFYGDQFRYAGAVGWLRYNGQYWESDNAEAHLDRCVVDILIQRRLAAVQAQAEAIVRKTEASAHNLNGTKKLFQSLVTASISEFDADPEALNCANGVVNLRTGQITPHSPAQRYTYCVPVDYDPRADYVEWIEFLAAIVPVPMIDYLQLALGYSLTGHTREECLFYIHGPTRSGKGTVAETLLAILPRPLGVEADFNTFTAKREGDTQNFDLAPLKPTRLIVASESNKYDTLNEAKIKMATGGNEIRCAFKHRDHFEYRPQFKIWLMSNYPVSGDTDDAAFWGRMRVIEFPHSFLGREDKTLKQRMKDPANLRGVLAWAVAGAMKWFALPQGLPIPPDVQDAVNKHRNEADYVQQWLDECCQTDPNGTSWTSNKVLYQSYHDWCDNNGVQAKQNRQFGRALTGKKFTVGIQRTSANGKVVRGVLGITII